MAAPSTWIDSPGSLLQDISILNVIIIVESTAKMHASVFKVLNLNRSFTL